MPSEDLLKIVITGHVDHGKSTLIGRLFFDTGSLPEERHREIREACARQGRAFELAYLTDALEEERLNNVTIDTAQSFFRSQKRPYVIIDAPGHKEFLKNMVTGAAAADAALLLVDGAEGIKDQTRRHAYVLSLLGIDQVVVAVNKLDLVGRSEVAFRRVEADARALLHSLGITPAFVVPCSAREGDNIARAAESMPWYRGPTILEALDSFAPRPDEDGLPLRFPVQDVYLWDRKRVYAGRVETGRLRRGAEVTLSPSGKRTRIATIERWGCEGLEEARSGDCVGVTLTEELFVERGEVLADGDTVLAADELRASIFWLGREPLKAGALYLAKLGTAEVEVRVSAIEERIDTSTLEVLERFAGQVEAHEVANVVLEARKPVAVETFDANPRLGRFVLVDGGRVAGGGIVRRAVSSQRGARTLNLDSRLCTEPDGNVVDLSADKGPLEVVASADLLRLLRRGERVLFKLRGPEHSETLARFAFEHGFELRFSRSGDGARALLLDSGQREVA